MTSRVQQRADRRSLPEESPVLMAIWLGDEFNGDLGNQRGR